jgi:hypothetical protein
MIVKTPKGSFDARAHIGQYGKYGRHYLQIAGHMLVEGTYTYCYKTLKRLESGKRLLPKSLLRILERRAHDKLRANLPMRGYYVFAFEVPYYLALHYRAECWIENDIDELTLYTLK